MFSNLRGKLQVVQDGLSQSFRNLKTKDDKNGELSAVNYNAGEEILAKKESQWEQLRSLADLNFCKAQKVDEQISQVRNNVSKRWNDIKELNRFISSFPEFIDTMKNINHILASLQMLTLEIEEALDNIEDLVDKQELQRRQLDEKFKFSSYLEKKTNEAELLKAQLAEEHEKHIMDREKELQRNLKEKQQLCDIAFQQDLQLYKELGTLPMIRRNSESKLTLDDIQIEDNMEDLNELLEDT